MNRLHRYVSRLRLAKEALNFVIPHFETNPRVTWIIYLYTRTYIYIYTPWLFNIAMEKGTFIDGLPIKHGDFPWLCLS